MIKCTNCGIETKNPKFCSIKCRGKYYSGERNVANRPEVRQFHREHNPMKDPIFLEQHKSIMKEVNNKPETNIKRSKSLKDAWAKNPKRKLILSERVKGNNNPTCKPEVKLKLKQYCREKASGWIDGRSSLPYCYKFNFSLREAVRFRDNHTCQNCGKTKKQEFNKIHKNLSVHHIHYDKTNCYPDLITLCNICNSKVNKKSLRKYFESFFMNKLNNRNLLFWTKRREI